MRFGRNAGTGLLVLRVGIGAVFFAHGWTKLFGLQISFVQGMLAMVGWEMPEQLLWTVAVLELAGGVALIVGYLVRPFALLLSLEMVVAVMLFHLHEGFFIASVPNAPLAYGFEYHVALVSGLVCLGLAGPGLWSIDARQHKQATSAPRAIAARN